MPLVFEPLKLFNSFRLVVYSLLVQFSCERSQTIRRLHSLSLGFQKACCHSCLTVMHGTDTDDYLQRKRLLKYCTFWPIAPQDET